MKKLTYILLIFVAFVSCKTHRDFEKQMLREIESRISTINIKYKWDYSFDGFNHKSIDSLLTQISNVIKTEESSNQLINQNKTIDLFTSNNINIDSEFNSRIDFYWNVLMGLDHLILTLDELRMDRLVYEPTIVAERNVIKVGETYECEIHLSVNHLYNEPSFKISRLDGEPFDTTINNLYSENWKGQFKYIARSKGKKTANGVILVEHLNGEEEIIPWNIEFEVE